MWVGRNKASRYLVAFLVGTQYYHIPSIRNGDVAIAASLRATDELCIRAA